MGKTSSEVKQRWKDKTYKHFNLYLRKDEDNDYIEYLNQRKESGDSIADIVKEGLDAIIKK